MSTPDISHIRTHAVDVLEATQQEVDEIYLFGSHARGDAREDSDIDIALIDESFEDVPMYKRGRWFKREWDYVEVGPLELLCLTPAEYETRLEAGQETVSNITIEGISLLDS